MRNADFIDLLTYLKQCRCITQQEYNGLKNEIIRDYGLNLPNLIALFAGANWTRAFVLSLPLSLEENSSSPNVGFTDFIVKDFAWSRGEDLKGWQAIKSIYFMVSAPLPGATFTWTFPFGTSSPSQASNSYRLTHDRGLEVSIEWPAYSQRSVQGIYQGILQAGEYTYHIVGNFLMAYEGAPQYSMTFSDESYEVENHTTPITIALDLFNAADFPYSDLIQRIVIPGLKNTLKDFETALPLKSVGFVLEKTLSEVLLKEISGTLPLTSSPGSDWWPFKKTSFSIDSLRIILKGFDALVSKELMIQLNGNMDQFQPGIPFRLSAGFSGQDTVFEIAVFPDFDRLGGKLSIQQILDVSNMSSVLDVSRAFPSLSGISNAFSVSHASIGWGNKGINFLRLGMDIEEWNILPEKFRITDLSFDICATFPVESKRFSLWGSGIVQISGVDLQVLFDIELHRVAFQLVMLENTLTLKSIFGHFLEESDTLLLHGLVSVLEETGIESVIVEGSPDGSDCWSLSRFALSASISTQLNISDKFRLLSPRLAVDVAFPFTTAKRIINASISATTELAGSPCDTLVSWAGDRSSLAVAFEPSVKPLLLGALISLFIPKETSSLSFPPSLTFLTGIGLADAKLIFSSSTDGFRLSEMSATIVSSTSLRFWAGLQLNNLKLFFKYSNLPGREDKSITLSATLSFAQANLNFVISYDGPDSRVIASQPARVSDRPTKVTTSKNETWIATATYAGTISVLEIMSGVSGIDMGEELSSVGLSALRQVIDINLSDLSLVLTHKADKTSFTFDAHVKYIFFDGPVHLAISRSASWIYSFTFDLSSDDFFSSLGIHGISLTNSTITLSNAPVIGSLLVNTVTTSGLNVTFAGTLIFTNSLEGLAKVTGNPSLCISGSVSDSAFTLAASTSDISLFNGMNLTGNLFISYSIGSKQLVAAIKGRVSNIYFTEISTERFSTTFSLFVKLPNPELGLQFTVDKLENAFGIKDLSFKGIIFRAAFQEFPIPSEVTIAGSLRFQVDGRMFYGSVAIYYSEFDLLHCGTMGTFRTFPSFNQALKGFDSAGRLGPQAVDGTFADLKFSRALQEVRVGEIVIPQGFVLKGSLDLPSLNFETSFDIEISPSRIHVDGNIKNAITVTVDETRLFALTHASDPNRGPSLDLTIEHDTPPNCYFSGEIYLLGLSAAAQFELSDNGMQFHETISTWLAGVKVDFVINSTIYLDFSASCTLDLSLPPFKVGKVDIPHIKVIKFAASLATQVHWVPITWELAVTGKMSLVDWDMGQAGPFTLDADLSDFTKITDYLVEHVKEDFDSLFKGKVAEILAEGLKEAVNELENIGLVAEKTTELLVKEFDCDLEEVIKQVGEIFEIGEEEMAKIMKDLGTTAEKVARILKGAYSVTANSVVQILKQAGYAVDDVGRVLQDVYGVASNEVTAILKQAGYTVDDVGRALKVVYGVTSTEMASFLQQAGYTVHDIGRVLEGVYGETADTVASILKDTGYTVDDVGRVLEDVFHKTANEIAAILKGAGYVIDDIARALEVLTSVHVVVIAGILQETGYAAEEVARTLEDVFSMAGAEAAQVLNDIGYAIQDVDRAINDVFGAIGDAAAIVGDAVVDVVTTAGDAIGSIFD